MEASVRRWGGVDGDTGGGAKSTEMGAESTGEADEIIVVPGPGPGGRHSSFSSAAFRFFWGAELAFRPSPFNARSSGWRV